MDDIIKNAVTPVEPICVPNVYAGESEEYCVYNYTEIPENFGDDAPQAKRYLVQLHWFYPFVQGISATPEKKTKRRALQQALFDAGTTWPSVTPAGDSSLEHYVFECEYAGEV